MDNGQPARERKQGNRHGNPEYHRPVRAARWHEAVSARRQAVVCTGHGRLCIVHAIGGGVGASAESAVAEGE